MPGFSSAHLQVQGNVAMKIEPSHTLYLHYLITTILLAISFCPVTGCRGFAARARGPATSQSQASAAGETLWLTGNGLRLKTKIFCSAKLSQHPVLIVVLHGDAPFHPPSYQYEFAHQATAQLEDAVVVPVLRPGYTDDSGEQSQGVRGRTTGDNYTPQVVDSIAQVIEQLKKKFQPSATLLAGHSGGAAISANLLGRWPSTVNGALLVSCPCDLPAWRSHMLKMQANPIWLAPVDSLSPLDLAGKVPATIHVRMLVGSEDPVAPPELTQRYAEALHNHGVDVTVTNAPGLKHDILLEPVAFTELKNLVKSVGH
jgi:pimeloyl-ACP methyl ester carboxylesterase